MSFDLTPGNIAPLTAGAAITAGQQVEVDANGEVVPTPITRAEFVKQLVAALDLADGQTLLSGSTTAGWEARRGNVTARGRTIGEALEALAEQLRSA